MCIYLGIAFWKHARNINKNRIKEVASAVMDLFN